MNSEAATVELEAASVPVFLDSGAFSEVEFAKPHPTKKTKKGTPVMVPCAPFVAKPISDDDWKARLAYSERLARALGDRLYFVAPDQVAFPGETLGRLSRYRREVRRIARLGARVLVCLQGADKVDFWRKAALALDIPRTRLVASLPMKKNATTPDEVVDFVRRAKPKAIHLLGLGAANDKAPELLERLAEIDPELVVSLDSNLIRANVGRKGKVRKLTAALDEIASELYELALAGSESVGMSDLSVVSVEDLRAAPAPTAWTRDAMAGSPALKTLWKATTAERKRRAVARAFAVAA
jgi:hypothetical protein